MATEKQINYAKTLGIDNPEQYDTKVLSSMIDVKLGSKKPTASSSKNFTATSNIVITRVEKPHSLEVGKPGLRHKIYYATIEELEIHIQLLKQAGLMSDPIVEGNIVETEQV